MTGVDKDGTIAIPALSLRKIDGDPIRARFRKEPTSQREWDRLINERVMAT
jgi:hypothetical protein